MSRATIMWRNEERDVTYRDHGYEWDTGAHEIEWEFDDRSMNDPDLFEITEDEQDWILEQLHEIAADEYDPY